MSDTAAPQMQPHFSIEKLYVKDLSVEVPNGPTIFLERESPRIDVQLRNEAVAVSADVHETSVTVVVTAKLNDKVVFLIEATQAGIFRVNNIVQPELESVLEVVCPNILYPYLREVVSESSVRAGFPPVLLNPVDFTAFYAQKKQQAQAGAPVAH